MGSKGQSTQAQSQQQTYTPDPQAAAYINQALTRAGNTANLPFAIPQAPVAGFSQDQRTAFGNVNAAQGMAQPYFNQAQSYFSPQGAQDFLNPYASNVMANLQDVFGQQNSQNTGQLTQAAGGVGADRIAVGQSELAKQQGLVAGQTMSGLYRDAVSQAQGAGYGTAALGSASQNAAISGAQAQLGTGSLQQQLEQAQLNSPYQRQLAQAAFPYQQSQFFSGQVGALAPGLGGTTSGFSNGTATPAQPSMFSQVLGAGVTGAGLYGQYGGGGKGSDPAYGMGNGVYGGSSSNPLQGLSASDYGAGFAEGGEVDDAPNPYRLPPGFNDDPINIAPQSAIPEGKIAPIAPHMPQLNFSQPQQQQSGGGFGDILKSVASIAPFFLNRGGSVNPYADGGDVPLKNWREAERERSPRVGNTEFQIRYDAASGRPKMRSDMDYAKRVSDAVPRGYADGGAPSFDDRFDASFPARNRDPDVVNPDEPYRMPDQAAVDDWRRDTDRAMAFSQPQESSERSTAFPYAAPARAGRAGAPAAVAAPYGGQAVRNASEDAPAARDTGFAGSPWAALTAAGLGMMAGTSPFAGVNIGQGGQQGLKMLAEQRAASQKDETIDQASRRLAQEAKFHEDQYTRLTQGQMQAADLADRPYREMTAAQRDASERSRAAADRPYTELTAAEKEAARRADRPYTELTAEQKAAGERADRPYTEMTAAQAAAAERGKYVPAGSLITPDGEVHPIAVNQNNGEAIDTVTGAPPVGGKIVPKGAKNIDDNDAKALATYYVKTGDKSRLNGLGISGEARQRVQHYVVEAQQEHKVSDEELATRVAEWEGRKAGQRTLGVMESRMGAAAFEAEGAIKLARGVIEKLPRTSFLPFNQLAEGFSNKTLNPDQTELYGRTQAIVNTYAAVMARGANITTDTARGHAEKLLNTAGNPATYNRMLDTMLQEIEMAKKSPSRMRNFYRGEYGEKSLAPETASPGAAPDAAAAPAEAAPSVGARKQFKQGWGVWDGKAWVPE